MELVSHPVEEYLIDVIPERDLILAEMEDFAAQRDFPIVGPLVGRFLYLVTKAKKARRVLEMGSGFGYSGFWFAKAVGARGKVICIDMTGENEQLAQSYLKRGRIANRVEFHVGDALKLVDKIEGDFDIVFLDIEKADYPKALKKVVARLRKGGLLIADNALRRGKIFDKRPDTGTAGILTFNRMLYASKDLFTSIIPLRDGVSISLKL
jgi:predicted O-methyltransferase YrrM